ncbi:MAG: hypothetical protein V4467_04755, partial [Patescibacteria group bacterium]
MIISLLISFSFFFPSPVLAQALPVTVYTTVNSFFCFIGSFFGGDCNVVEVAAPPTNLSTPSAGVGASSSIVAPTPVTISTTTINQYVTQPIVEHTNTITERIVSGITESQVDLKLQQLENKLSS